MVTVPTIVVLSLALFVLMRLTPGSPLQPNVPNANPLFDYLCTLIAMIGVSIPNFVMAIVFIVVFVLGLKAIPYTGGWEHPPAVHARPLVVHDRPPGRPSGFSLTVQAPPRRTSALSSRGPGPRDERTDGQGASGPGPFNDTSLGIADTRRPPPDRARDDNTDAGGSDMRDRGSGDAAKQVTKDIAPSPDAARTDLSTSDSPGQIQKTAAAGSFGPA